MCGGIRCLVVLLAFSIAVEATYEDARCKCVCVDHSVLKVSNESSTEPKRSVYVKSIPSDKCTCQIMLEDKSDLCPYCDCKYQVRNTATIKVVVIMIVVILSTLSIYLLFMLILESFLSSRGRNNPMSGTQSSFSPSKTFRTFRSYTTASQDEQRGSRESPSGSTAVVNRVPDQQSNWKGRIEAQRERVFSERTILN
nr:TMEM9 [Hymenolepis microstoma]